MPVEREQAEALGLSLKALFSVTRRARAILAEAHREVPMSLVSLLAEIDKAADATSVPTPTGPVPGCRLKDVAARTLLDPSTISREIAQLIALGFVERRCDPLDRRSARLVVTAAGHALLALAKESLAGLLSAALSDWEPQELTALAVGMQRLADDVTARLQAVPSPPPVVLSPDPAGPAPINTPTPQGVAR